MVATISQLRNLLRSSSPNRKTAASHTFVMAATAKSPASTAAAITSNPAIFQLIRTITPSTPALEFAVSP